MKTGVREDWLGGNESETPDTSGLGTSNPFPLPTLLLSQAIVVDFNPLLQCY